MSNHPNRGPKGPSANPSPEQVRAAREAAGLTQTEAAALIYSTLRTWQDWEAKKARMHPGLWELFRIKARMTGRSAARRGGPVDVNVRGWIIKYPDGAYNSGEGNANGFPVRLEEATIYKTIAEAETKAKDLGEVEILEAPN